MIMRKITAYCLVAALFIANISICFADEDVDEIPEESAPVVKTIAYLDFTGPTIELSLEQALKDALKGGNAIEAAELKKKADAADARSNQESLDNMQSANNDPESNESYGRSKIDSARKAAAYYRTMADRNYEAATNQIVYNITNSYYSLLHAEENARIAEESLKLQEQILVITEQKFTAGIAPNQDVMQAEINVNNAKAELASVGITLAEKKMVFNADIGYTQMQDVKMTSPLTRAEPSTLALDKALSQALENRNELFTCAYNITRAESDLASWRGYAVFSSVYKARNALASAEKSYRDTENSITREVRMNYANMLNNQTQITNAELSAEKASKSFEVNLAKYQLGMSTLSEVQQAQIESFKAEKSVVDVILKYNLSILEYDQSATVGRSSN